MPYNLFAKTGTEHTQEMADDALKRLSTEAAPFKGGGVLGVEIQRGVIMLRFNDDVDDLDALCSLDVIEAVMKQNQKDKNL